MIYFVLGMFVSAGLFLLERRTRLYDTRRAVEVVLDRDEEVISENATVLWNRRTMEWSWIDNNDVPVGFEENGGAEK